MAEPLTWQALELIKARVETIRIENGFHTDLGLGLVTLDTGRDADGGLMTLIAATDIPIDDTGSGNRTTRGQMDVVVEFYVPFGDDDVAELIAHRARADLVRVLRAPLRGALKGIENLVVTGSRIGSPEETAGVVVAQVTARVDLTETSSTTP